MTNREVMAKMKKDAESFVSCVYDPNMGTYRLSLHWWVTYEISIHRYKLEALKRVIDRALKEKK